MPPGREVPPAPGLLRAGYVPVWRLGPLGATSSDLRALWLPRTHSDFQLGPRSLRAPPSHGVGLVTSRGVSMCVCEGV